MQKLGSSQPLRAKDGAVHTQGTELSLKEDHFSVVLSGCAFEIGGLPQNELQATSKRVSPLVLLRYTMPTNAIVVNS